MGRQYLDLPNLGTEDGIGELYAAGFWTLEHLNISFKTLTRAGQLEVAFGEYKELSKQEKLTVIADVRAGDLISALDRFINFSFDGNTPQMASSRIFCTQHPELVAKAAWFVWAELHAAELTSTDITAFRKHMRGHVLPTLKLLEDSFFHWKASADSRVVETQLAPPPSPEPTRAELEKLSPEDLDERIRDAQRSYLRGRYL